MPPSLSYPLSQQNSAPLSAPRFQSYFAWLTGFPISHHSSSSSSQTCFPSSAELQGLAQAPSLGLSHFLTSFKQHQHAGGPHIFLSTPHPAANYPTAASTWMSVISEITCLNQDSLPFQKSVLPITGNSTSNQPSHWGLTLDSLPSPLSHQQVLDPDSIHSSLTPSANLAGLSLLSTALHMAWPFKNTSHFVCHHGLKPSKVFTLYFKTHWALSCCPTCLPGTSPTHQVSPPFLLPTSTLLPLLFLPSGKIFSSCGSDLRSKSPPQEALPRNSVLLFLLVSEVPPFPSHCAAHPTLKHPD